MDWMSAQNVLKKQLCLITELYQALKKNPNYPAVKELHKVNHMRHMSVLLYTCILCHYGVKSAL